MPVLHIIHTSPEHADLYQRCMDSCHSHDAILLIEDGVYAATMSTPLFTASDQAETSANNPVNTLSEKKKGKRRNIAMYALNTDVTVRALRDKVHAHITLIDYDAMVILTEQFYPIQSW